MEIWDLYDENRNLLNQTHKRGDEIPEGYFHLVVHVWIKNKQNKYLISQRSGSCKSFPLMFECVGGSALQGEESVDAAIREVQEEVGLKFEKNKAKTIHSEIRKEYRGEKYNDILDVYLFEYDGEIDLSFATTDEVKDVCWMSMEEIESLANENKLIPSLEYIFDYHKKIQKQQEKNKKLKKNKEKSKYNRDKSKYFDYYDDIKHGSHKVIDW